MLQDIEFDYFHFLQMSKSDVFKEVTLQKNVDFAWIKWLESQTPEMVKDENYK